MLAMLSLVRRTLNALAWGGPGSAMTHLAITGGMVDGKALTGKELVTDEQYHAH